MIPKAGSYARIVIFLILFGPFLMISGDVVSRFANPCNAPAL